MDFITSQGNKLRLTTAAEALAGSGHDILAFSTWLPAEYANHLEPVDDIMGPLIEQNGAVNRSEEHTSELQSLMRISYAVFCLKKKKITNIVYVLHNTNPTVYSS